MYLNVYSFINFKKNKIKEFFLSAYRDFLNILYKPFINYFIERLKPQQTLMVQSFFVINCTKSVINCTKGVINCTINVINCTKDVSKLYEKRHKLYENMLVI